MVYLLMKQIIFTLQYVMPMYNLIEYSDNYSGTSGKFMAV